jgi:ferritin-like metal-binding protein YciE
VSGHRHPRGAPPAGRRVLDARVHDALSDLYAHALIVDAERQRLEAHLASPRAAASPSERAAIERRRCELAERQAALARTIDRVRREADPEGRFL